MEHGVQGQSPWRSQNFEMVESDNVLTKFHDAGSRQTFRNDSGSASQVDKTIHFVKNDAMSRLTIEIDPEQHRKIKTMASFAGMTLKDFILARTLPHGSPKEDATEKLMSSPKNAARLRKALASPDSANRVFESVEDVKNALGV